MIYSNEKLRIVPFERGKHMTEEYRSWFHDPEVTKYNSHGLFPYTASAMEEFVAVIEKGSSSKIVWAIEIPYVDKKYPDARVNNIKGERVWLHIGNCSLDRINWINRSAEITIVLGRERGKGYGLQACEWMLKHAFEKLNLNRVWTGTAATNIGMQRVCEKLYMKKEGVLKDGMFLNGAYTDIFMYATNITKYNMRRR